MPGYKTRNCTVNNVSNVTNQISRNDQAERLMKLCGKGLCGFVYDTAGTEIWARY